MDTKVALITGSTSGIGLGIAEHLASMKCSIAFHGLGDPNAIRELVESIQNRFGVKCQFFDEDLNNPENAHTLVEQTVQTFGKIDILVNNAGIQHVAPLEIFPLGEWEKVLNINLTSPFVLMQAALIHMKRQNSGRIINIASVHGLIASAQKSAYVASKHGIIGLTKVAALETAQTPITCNAICPGWVFTPLVAKQIEDRAKASGKTFEEEKLALLLEKQPSGEFASVEQIASLVAYLCSDDAGQIRGAAITMDGGWTAQ
ncbi:MAG: 3-hydroxybutyrate dehydrogenase [Alphaproteobacteria bacterium]|nr:3-hydroxybutyrate dehydrogenase [Alphaproteobacteria bacterium]OJV46315.1 MAG: 3-hydroxybutyrate dehydrogenase [Alphaproteobacteria bacterium 43-37]